MSERTPAERERELVARQLARQAKNDRHVPRRPWWAYALALVLCALAFVIGTVALLGVWSAPAALVLILLALAAVA